MKYKTRDISTFDFLQALQKEYICLQIRRKIYMHRNDKDYFKNLLEKKRQSILLIANKNRLDNIIDSEQEYIKVWQEIVPKFGMPNFIYNIVKDNDKKLYFPYKGTVVKFNDLYGMSEKVNFDTTEVHIRLCNNEIEIRPMELVDRVNPQETDEYFYYYPGNMFNCNGKGCGVLENYDMLTKIALISFDGQLEASLHRDEISRIL